MKPYISLISALSIGWLIFASVLAQSDNFTITSWTISNGGGTSSKDSYALTGAVGQIHAGNVSKGENYTITDGFWSLETAGVTSTGSLALYLPVLAKAPISTPAPPLPTPTPTPLPSANPTWQLVGGRGLPAAALISRNNQLFTGVRAENGNGGLYKHTLTTCVQAELTKVDLSITAVFDIAFQGSSKGVIVTYATNPFYSSDGGATWTLSASPVIRARTVGVASDGQFYAGTEDQGVYASDDGGITWKQQTQNRPRNINRVRLYQGALWIGTEDDGVWTLSANSSQPSEKNNGLTGDARKVYDFAFHEASGIYYIATFDGIYKGDGGAWQSFGLPGSKMLSLAIVGDQLYAGAHKDSGGGVWRRPRNASKDWERIWDQSYTVRALLNDDETCKGLLAATNDGVWIYR